MITLRSLKQKVGSYSSTKVENRAVAVTFCVVVWLKYFVQDLDIRTKLHVHICHDIQVSIFIAKNLTFQEPT